MKPDKVIHVFSTAIVTAIMLLIVTGFTYYEVNRTAFIEQRMEKAVQEENWEEAVRLAKTADAIDEGARETEVLLKKAGKVFSNGDYASALLIYEALGDSPEAQAGKLACRYAEAEEKEKAGLIEEAAALYLKLSGFGDALERYDACRYQMAQRLWETAADREVFLAFIALGDYADARETAAAIAMSMTGEKDPEKAILLAQGYSEETWAEREQFTQAREELTCGILAAGREHYLQLQDGMVSAFGSNIFGQCETSSWKNVKTVVAGAYYSAGLCEDGTVVACGDNEFRQCDTEGWTDITAVAAGEYDLFGLTKSGTVVHTGLTDMSITDGWQNITAIAAGNCVFAALRSDGTVLCTFTSGNADGSMENCGLRVNMGWTAVLKKDGSVESPLPETASWEKILLLESSQTVLAGIDDAASVHAVSVLPGGRKLASLLNGESGVSALSLSGAWAVLLGEDGSVRCIGELPETLQ